MGAFVALAGWPAAEPPETHGRPSSQRRPIAIGREDGPGPAVVSATSADGRPHVAVAGSLANRRGSWRRSIAPRRGGRSEPRRAGVRLYGGPRRAERVGAGEARCRRGVRRTPRPARAGARSARPAAAYAAARGHRAAATRPVRCSGFPEWRERPTWHWWTCCSRSGRCPRPRPRIRIRRFIRELRWEPGRIRAQRYWQLGFRAGRRGATAASEAARRVREQLDDAVPASARRAWSPGCSFGRARRGERSAWRRRSIAVRPPP